MRSLHAGLQIPQAGWVSSAVFWKLLGMTLATGLLHGPRHVCITADSQALLSVSHDMILVLQKFHNILSRCRF